MKTNLQSKASLLILSFLFFIWLIPVKGQDKFVISAGMGLPELMNVDARYLVNQTQFGVGIGTFPVKDESIISVTGDIYYHFAGSSKFSDRHTWYGRAGLDYLRDETNSILDKYLYLNLRIGRDFNFSDKIGIEFDLGGMVQLYNETIHKVPQNGWEFGIDSPVLPGISLGFFYRI